MTVLTPPSSRQAAWPVRPKLRIRRQLISGEDPLSRPLTATLDHPLVLNPALLSKLDMTMFTKQGLLAITKLCEVPLMMSRTKEKKRRRAVDNPGHKSSASPRVQQKPQLKEAKKGKKLAKQPSVLGAVPKAVDLPQPCRACGRPEQPERLHSHPVGVISARPPKPAPTQRTAITKPVPANFKSAGKLRIVPKSGQRDTSDELESLKNLSNARPSTGKPSSGRSRMVTCYICSREFGTASFPIHEPKCIEKWERENALLPQALRRKLPPKPSSSHLGAEWNDLAWRTSQNSLVPCDRCGRTFLPDRLAVHSRSCKCTGKGSASSVPSPSSSPSPTFTRPPTVPCYICGREFGSKSINIHEPQCLKKWKVENAALPQALQRPEPKKPEVLDMAKVTGCYICGTQVPPKERQKHEESCLVSWKKTNNARPEDQRLPEPIRPDYRFSPNGAVDMMGTWNSIWSNHMESLVPCRTCARKFFPDRILKHEAVCQNMPPVKATKPSHQL